MKFADASNINRKSGAAQWRDLLFAYSATALDRSATLPVVIPSAVHSRFATRANKSRRDGRK
jgi:hypothetical protein